MKVEIYQVNMDNDNVRDILFMPYDWIIKKFPEFNKEWKNYYKKVYEYDIEDTNRSNESILEDAFRKLNGYDGNTEFPEDFKGHSLSVSDIIVLDEKSVYMCDSFGWEEIRG